MADLPVRKHDGEVLDQPAVGLVVRVPYLLGFVEGPLEHEAGQWKVRQDSVTAVLVWSDEGGCWVSRESYNHEDRETLDRELLELLRVPEDDEFAGYPYGRLGGVIVDFVMQEQAESQGGVSAAWIMEHARSEFRTVWGKPGSYGPNLHDVLSKLVEDGWLWPVVDPTTRESVHRYYLKRRVPRPVPPEELREIVSRILGCDPERVVPFRVKGIPEDMHRPFICVDGSQVDEQVKARWGVLVEVGVLPYILNRRGDFYVNGPDGKVWVEFKDTEALV